MTTDSSSPSDFLAQIEAALTADWAKFVAFIRQAEQDIGAFLVKVAQGAEIAITDVDQVANYVAGHLSTINGSIDAIGVLAGQVAPNNADVAKVLDDLRTGAQDVALLHSALASGSSSGDPAIVTQAVTTINAVHQLAQIVSGAQATLSTVVANSPTATQAATPPSGGTNSEG